VDTVLRLMQSAAYSRLEFASGAPARTCDAPCSLLSRNAINEDD
jgi:hypothetical protein